MGCGASSDAKQKKQAEAEAAAASPVDKPVEDKKMASTELLKRCVVCCGPSGAGKSTLIKRLMADFPGKFGFSISNTTRGPREGEKDAVDYYFIAKEEFEKKIEAKEMLEYAHVHTNMYGTSFQGVQSVVEKDQTCILDIDVQGCDLVKKIDEESLATYLFISPPSFEALEERLRSRGTETEEKIQVRLTNAKKEMEYKEKEGFWNLVIVNDDLEKAYAEFKEVMEAKIVKTD